MGPVSTPECDYYRGLLAAQVVGEVIGDEALALSGHLDGCADCRLEAADLRALAAVLPAADIAHLEGHQMPIELEKAVLDGLQSEVRRDLRSRRARRVRYAVGGAVAAGVVALAVVLATVLPAHPGQTVALTGERGVQASIHLTAESWGTAVDLQESGQPGGEVLTVAMQTTSGTWWTAGTYRTVSGKHVHVDMACAVRIADIATVWVKDHSGRTVLRGYVS
jgi:hypothetical protein